VKYQIETIQTQILGYLPKQISSLVELSINQYEEGNYTMSLKSLSNSLFLLLRDEYYIPEGLVLGQKSGVVDMLRELRNRGKDPGKSETASILRIHEKAGLDEVDVVILETCYQGALDFFKTYLQDKETKIHSTVEISGRKSPGRLILNELNTLFGESDSEQKIQEHFSKIEEIYNDFPYDIEVQKMYFQFLSLVNEKRAKKEILSYLESGDVTIHLGSVCITLLAEMGYLYDAKKKLDWYNSEFSGEKDGIYAELFVFIHAYLKDQRESDKKIVEELSDIIGSRKETYYKYIENCFHIFSGGDAIRPNSEGFYLYKEYIFREKVNKSTTEEKVDKNKKNFSKAPQKDKVIPKPQEKFVEDTSDVIIFDEKDEKLINKVYYLMLTISLIYIFFIILINKNNYNPQNESSSKSKVNQTNTFEATDKNNYVVQKDSEWSPYMGSMNWEDANKFCKSEGLRLPTIEELKDAYDSGLTKEWQINGYSYWSSTPYDEENYYLLDVYYGNYYYNRNYGNNVRCHY
jgi:hypothetical protein